MSEATTDCGTPSETVRGTMEQRDQGLAGSGISTEERRQWESEISLAEIASILLRHRSVIIRMTLLFPILVGIWTLVGGHSWTATTSFMPQTSSTAGSNRIAALAGQFGIDVGGGEPGASPEFYASLVVSREILGKIAADTFSIQNQASLFSDSSSMRGTLGDLLQFDEDPPQLRRAGVIKWLEEQAVAAEVGTQTGVVEVSVTTPWAVVSDSIARHLVDLVNEFNLQTRQSQANAERRFVEDRMVEAQEELLAAENALQRFLQNNRAYGSSPELAFEEDRLRREVNMRQQVYTSLAQTYEQARIAEVRNTPVITVVEEPEAPVLPDRRHLLLRLVLGIVLGGILGVGVAFSREYVRKTRARDPSEIEEVATLWQETVDDLRKVGRRFRRQS